VEGTFFDERVVCVGCGAALVVEYSTEAGGHASNIGVTCPACQRAFDVVLPRPASIFIVRRSGDTPVLRRRVRPQ
jgi:hypothetical protein